MESVKLCRNENIPWGFRLAGGKDFGLGLSVQKVNPGSIAEKNGLRTGDAVVVINGQETDLLRHKEAQDAIIRAGNYLEMKIQRGGADSWKAAGGRPTLPKTDFSKGKPAPKPAQVPAPAPAKASAAPPAKAPAAPPAKAPAAPPPPQAPTPTAGDTVTAVVHQQYNTPMAMYSMDVIAETLSAHVEMIAPGVKGINFMKPEKPINTMSEVYRLVQEEEQTKGDGTPSPAPSPVQPFSHSLRKIQGNFGAKAEASSPTPPREAPPMMAPRRTAPPAKIPPPVAPKPTISPVQAPSGSPAQSTTVGPQATCSDCGRYIPGVFIRLSDRTLHEECFKCSTCGTSLKNMGYININNKLYCDVHAKMAAQVIGPGKEPASVPFAINMGITPAAPPSSAPPAPKVSPPPPPKISPPPPQTLPSAPAPLPLPPQVQQNLINLPQTPSSSGGLPFRSISPIPFKRGAPSEVHRVMAPTSPPTSQSTQPSFPQQTGPLPFEMTPYMPPEPPKQTQSIFSSSQVSQSSQMSQMSQQTTQITQTTQMSQSSQYQVDYKQVVGQQRTKFVWPPPKPDEPVAPVFESNATPTVPCYRPPPGTQHVSYSPLVMTSTPPSASQPPVYRPVQPPVPLPSSAPAPSFTPQPFVPPPLPSSFIQPPTSASQASAPGPMPEPLVFPSEPPAPEPKEAPPAPVEAPAPVPAPAPAPIPPPQAPAPLPPVSAPSGPLAPGFTPVLPHVADPGSEPKPAAPQSGVPTGAGSRPAPKRGRGQLKEQTPGSRIPICAVCGTPIRGPFVTALGKTWCPDHFHCNNSHCKMPLQDIGFVEEQGQLYCENCYEAFLAPICNKCGVRIKGDCLNALDKQWHPDCFICAYCQKAFGNNSFYLEDGLPYCEKDWNELFTTKCVGCGYPIEAGDRWVEALNNNYHSQCFKCSICNKNLEGQSFYAKGGRPFCKAHAR